MDSAGAAPLCYGRNDDVSEFFGQADRLLFPSEDNRSSNAFRLRLFPEISEDLDQPFFLSRIHEIRRCPFIRGRIKTEVEQSFA
jgi:hypothetical protein